MPLQVLLEGCQLMLPEGTGIVTYARNLAAAVSAGGGSLMRGAIRALDSDHDLRAELNAKGLQRAAFFSPEADQRRVTALCRSVIG
jgi:hypothetical protein